jgi:hypothetical protein
MVSPPEAVEADEGASLHSFTAPAATSMDQEAATTESAPQQCRYSHPALALPDPTYLLIS